MWEQDLYVREKLRDLESERLTWLATVSRPAARRRPVIGPVLRSTGRLLQRIGGGLESWATPADAERLELERNPR